MGKEHNRTECPIIQGKCKNNTNRNEDHHCQYPLEERADINIRNIDMEISGNDELQECINNLQESIADGTYMNIMDCICCSDTLQIDSGIESVLDSLGVVRYQVP